ncbi:MAG: metalloregulator ArsR/SmtB family transcription factor [Methylacidiphilaceae bacterium]|nr:metalloregulator ArsR/SmtB family transcription factor [Candidatus Methylacidiphilaceae bacterium]
MRASQAVEVLGALGQETRLDVFRLLIQAGPAGVPAGEIAARRKIPLATLSFHLQHLKHARLVRSKKQGKLVIYSANFRTIDQLIGYLLHDCCGRPRTDLKICAQAASESKPGAKATSERADS